MTRLFHGLALAAVFGLGMVIERGLWSRSLTADATSGPGAPGLAGKGTDAGTDGNAESVDVGKDSPKLTALLAGFDRRKLVASRVVVLEKIMAASAGDVAEIAKAMSRSGWNDEGWRETKLAVLRRWLELAPDEAIAWAKAVQRGGEDPHYLPCVLGELARRDPTRAVAEAQRLTNPTQKNSALAAVAGTIAQSDPEHAYRLALTLSPYQYKAVFQSVLDAWVERDSADIASSMATLKNVFKAEQERDEVSLALLALLGRWTTQDPAAALAWAKGLSGSNLQYQALTTCFYEFAGRDPEGAIAQISEFPRDEQGRLLETVVNRWMSTDHAAATAWVLARPDRTEQQRLIRVAVTNRPWHGNPITDEVAAPLVAMLDPGPAREHALNELGGGGRLPTNRGSMMYRTSFRAVGEMGPRESTQQRLTVQPSEPTMTSSADKPERNAGFDLWSGLAPSLAEAGPPAIVTEWEKTRPDGISTQKAVPAVGGRRAEENPAGAAKGAVLFPDEATRLLGVRQVAAKWLDAGMEQALTWAKELAGKEREAAIGGVLEGGAPQQPTLAATEFTALMAEVAPGTKPADGMLTAAGTIAAAYFAENEHAAVEWSAALPQEEARAAAVKSLVEQWAEYDPTGVRKWIGTLPGGAPREAAVGELVGKMAAFDPATAFALAGTVADPGRRSSLLQTTLTSWRKIDASAARAAIQATDWPEREKAKWLNRLR